MTHPINEALSNPITEDDIAHYLSITPDFFARHAQLLAAVQLTSPHSHRAISLQERQAELLREKIKMLEQRIMEMIRNGNDNLLLSDKVLRWSSTLLKTADVEELPIAIANQIESEFAVPQVALRVWDVSDAYADKAYAQGVSDDAKMFASSLATPFCGLNTGFEAVSWLDDPDAVVSIALVPLRTAPMGVDGPAFGMLVLASPDSQRFTSGMGVEFLAHIGEMASAALSRLRPPQ